MPKTRPPYPPEFRREALELLNVSGKSISQVAKDLGVSEQTLSNWRRQAQIDAGKREGLTQRVSARSCAACARRTARCRWKRRS